MMQHLYSTIRESLQSCYPPSEASAIARLLLEKRFGISLTDIYTGKDRNFRPEQEQELEDILRRLCAYEPVQYVLGEADFAGLSFQVNPHVLIPRPETAELITWIVEEHPTPPQRIWDIGTGSGCIAITLSKQYSESYVEAWDLSAGALEVARVNNDRHQTTVHFLQQDILHPTDAPSEPFDLIVSNPPYITLSEKSEMEPNVLRWEPEGALFVPDDDPLRFYRHIALLGKERLRPAGALYLEINQAFGPQTIALLRETGYTDITLRKDLYGNDRMIKAILL